MNGFKFKEPSCSSCDYHNAKNYYVRYCKNGKKPRLFKSSDPKQKVPKWCPKRNFPTIIRVYGFKDNDAMHRDCLFNSGGDPALVLGTRYKLVFETKCFINAKGFFERARSGAIKELIDFEISIRNVVEIDDGLKPYYFYCKGYLDWTNINFTPPNDSIDGTNGGEKKGVNYELYNCL